MKNSMYFFDDTFNFFNTSEIEVNKYVDDLDSINKEESFVTYNGINTPEMLTAVILCLFRSGIGLFDSTAKKIIQEKGLKALKIEIEETAINLEKALNNTTYKRKNHTVVKKSELKEQMAEEDWEEWNLAFENLISEKKLNNIIVRAKQEGINLVKKSYYEFVKKYSHLYIKSTFLIDKAFMKEYGKNIYDDLIRENLLDAKYDQFKDFAKGIFFKGSLVFNQPSTLGTFIRILKENGLLKTGGNYWLYVTEEACDIVFEKKGEFSSAYMRKLQKTHRNKKVKNILFKYIDIFRSRK